MAEVVVGLKVGVDVSASEGVEVRVTLPVIVALKGGVWVGVSVTVGEGVALI